MLCFPPCDDIRLRHSPLSEVICQVRFPPILRIADQHPTEFQERVRTRFPQVDIGAQAQFQLRPLGEAPVSMELGPRLFRFKTRDGNTTATLGVGFYALSTTAYAHWNDFLQLIRFLNQAIGDVYTPSYVTRLGLRYVNNLTLQNTGSNSVSELLTVVRPEFTTLLQVDCWDKPLETLSQLLLCGEGDERLTLRSGLRGGEEPAFLLDFDYYSEGDISLDEVPALCLHYHDVIYSAFRWCIREDKLSVFEPILADEEG